jgi:hypothetical protein
MKFNDSIWINTPSRKVWEYVGSIEVWPRFYAATGKCEHVSPIGSVVGSLYNMTLGSGLRSTATHCEIVELLPGSMIGVRSTLHEGKEPMSRGWAAYITYELHEEGCRTKVTERVETSGFDRHLDLIAGVIGWLVYRFRRLAGVTNLQRLKGVVEGIL